MTPLDKSKRRLLVGTSALGALFLTGCDRLSETEWFPKVLRSSETLTRGVHQLLGSRRSMAQEFTDADLSPFFRSNGTSMPEGEEYQALAKNGFSNWRLDVDGLVEKRIELSLAELRAMPRRTQITRHDCVEGWSAIGKWTGVPLSNVLALVKPQPNARYVVFHCADAMGGSLTPEYYYESIDMDDAMHPQTILAYGLNDKDLPIPNGAPIRLRVERQLGYKHAKYVMRIELVETFANIAGGKGGYWEDNGYQWYAGI
ncbi:MAG TPA: molybdopterin-binding protein [Burkholderiaceae bacterium]|nr:molybdopterin-binding protein [Burkholderiaceae bacterium]